MATKRRTIYLGTGQGFVTDEFLGNAGCIHPIASSGNTEERAMENRLVSKMSEVQSIIKQWPNPEKVAKSNATWAAQIVASNESTKEHLDELVNKARKEIRAIKVDVNLISKAKLDIERAQQQIDTKVARVALASDTVEEVVSKFYDTTGELAARLSWVESEMSKTNAILVEMNRSWWTKMCSWVKRKWGRKK